MQNLFSTDLLYAPTEQGEYVYPKESYDYGAYDIEDGIYWSNEFTNDLSTGSNNSYGIMPVTGLRKKQHWGVSSFNPSAFPIVGTRGPEMAVEGGEITDIDKYSNSYLMHGIDTDYKGTITFGDGHNEILETYFPIATTYVKANDEVFMDCIFFEEEDQVLNDDYMNGDASSGHGADAFLTHVILVEDDGTKGGSSDYVHD